MRKKMMMIVAGIVAIVALILGGWYVMFVHFGVGPAFPFVKVYAIDISDAEQIEIADDPLMALVETEEEAQEIAEQCDIELVSFENGIALYQTDEDPYEVIDRGKKNGYTQLSINYVRSLYGEDEVQRIYSE